MAKVLVYSTQACVYCKLLKDWLDEKKVEYEAIDVGTDHEKAQEMVDKTGQMGVPVIDIDGEVIVGFARDKIEATLKEKGLLKE